MLLCGELTQNVMKKQLFTIVLIGISGGVFGQCLPPSAAEMLSINNANAVVKINGTIWPGTQSSQQPKAWHSLWVGGLDVNGQLKLAAMRFGQQGNDYYPGPLNTVTATIPPESCASYDRVWKIEKWQVDEFAVRFNDPDYTAPDIILNWPAHGDMSMGEDYNLAQYYDADGSGHYNPYEGDFPLYYQDSLPGDYRSMVLKGDQTLWWIMNDAGGEHTESLGNPLKIEIRCMAYGFNTCGPLGDVTFHEYEIINRGAYTLMESYVGLWVDADAGIASNDRVQCDVNRSLGFVFDTLSVSGQTTHACGVNLLGGPYMNNDGIDNDGDDIVDNEVFRMSKFFAGSSAGDYTPATYYNRLRGKWDDETSWCYGSASSGCNGIATDFMFPGGSDPTGMGTGGVPQAPWFDNDPNAIPFDKRFLMSAGPFTMLPGAVNRLQYAVVKATEEDGSDPIPQLLSNSDLVRSVYDSAFRNMPCCPPTASISYQQPNPARALFSSIAEGQSYFWNFGDGHTSTDRFPTHTYTTGGNFQVCLTVTNACGTDTHCQMVQMSVGIADAEAACLGLTIYPNPSSSGFQVLLREGALVSIALTDALGRNVSMQAASGSSAHVPTAGLASGIYFATVVTDRGVVVERVVVE